MQCNIRFGLLNIYQIDILMSNVLGAHLLVFINIWLLIGFYSPISDNCSVFNYKGHSVLEIIADMNVQIFVKKKWIQNNLWCQEINNLRLGEWKVRHIWIHSYKIKGLLTLINNIVMHSMGFWWNASGNIGLPCNRFYFFSFKLHLKNKPSPKVLYVSRLESH